VYEQFNTMAAKNDNAPRPVLAGCVISIPVAKSTMEENPANIRLNAHATRNPGPDWLLADQNSFQLVRASKTDGTVSITQVMSPTQLLYSMAGCSWAV
jgi:hypothetical protein